MSSDESVSILFTDLAGSTEILSRLGDEAADILRRRHFEVLRDAIAATDGKEIKNLGDGLMVVFSRPAAAANCAVAMQDGIEAHNRDHPKEPLGLRVGLNHGPTIRDQDDYFGRSVVIAKRLCDRADASQILVSLSARNLVDKAYAFRDLGSLPLKGLADPIPTVELAWRQDVGVPSHGASGPAEPSEEDALAVGLPSALAELASDSISGRESAVQSLAAAYESVRDDRRPHIALLAGEPGIGKTRVAAEFASIVHGSGARVLFGRCDEGGLISFQPFLEALETYVEHAPTEALTATPHDHLGVLARLLPALKQRIAVVEHPRAEPEVERSQLFQAIRSLFAGMGGEEPIVLVLDDLHWADQASLLVLRHLMREGNQLPLLMVGTYRDVEVRANHPFSSVLSELQRARVVTTIELEGLTEREVAEMIVSWARQAPPPGLAAVIWRETEGHPFFVQEVLRHLLETGAIYESGGRLDSSELLSAGIPESIRSVVESRIAHFAEPTQRTLAIAAVVGRDFSARLLEQVCDLPSHELFEQLEDAVAARLVLESPGAPGKYRFSHALVRETLYGQLSATRRSHLHVRIAEAIEKLGSDGSDELVRDLAHHYFEATTRSDVLDKAIDFAIRAGSQATSQLAHEEAVAHFERAIHGLRLRGEDEQRQCEVLLELGESLWNSGKYGKAREAFSEAAGIAEQLSLAEPLARAALGVGGKMGLPLEGGIVDTVLITLLERALELLGSGHQPLRARLMGRLGSAMLFSADRDRGDELAQQAIKIARDENDDALLARILSDTWLARHRVGDFDERLRRGSEWVAIADRTGIATLRLESRFWYAATLWEAADFGGMNRELEVCRGLVEELRQAYYSWFFDVFETGRVMLVGGMERAEEMMWGALAYGRDFDNPLTVQLFSAQVLMLRLFQGRATEIYAGSRGLTEYFTSISAFRSGLASIYAELGLVKRAREEFERLAVNDFGDVSDDVFWLSTMYLLVDVCRYLDDRPRAATLYELLLPLADRYVVLGSMCAPAGHMERGLGVLAAMLDRPQEAVERLERAVSFEAQVGAMPALAFANCDLARALAVRGSEGDADSADKLLLEAVRLGSEHGLAGIERRSATIRVLLDGNRREDASETKSLSTRARALRDDAKAAITTRGRETVGKLLVDASDEELERRFGSPIALRGLMTAIAKGFQPRMAFGFEGEIQFEIRIPTASRTAQRSEWWTLHIEGTRAVARRRTANAPAVTIHANVADFVRIVGGLINPVGLWVSGRVEIDGDVLLGPRLVELFGGETPLDLVA